MIHAAISELIPLARSHGLAGAHEEMVRAQPFYHSFWPVRQPGPCVARSPLSAWAASAGWKVGSGGGPVVRQGAARPAVGRKAASVTSSPRSSRRIRQVEAALRRKGVEQDIAFNLAMPSARAGRAAPRAVLHRLGHAAPIAIAVFAALYFAGQLVRGGL